MYTDIGMGGGGGGGGGVLVSSRWSIVKHEIINIKGGRTNNHA